MLKEIQQQLNSRISLLMFFTLIHDSPSTGIFSTMTMFCTP